MAYFNTPPINFASERETPTNAYSIRSGTKITMSKAFSVLILHCASLVNRTILMPKDGLCWRKLLVNLALINLIKTYRRMCKTNQASKEIKMLTKCKFHTLNYTTATQLFKTLGLVRFLYVFEISLLILTKALYIFSKIQLKDSNILESKITFFCLNIL